MRRAVRWPAFFFSCASLIAQVQATGTCSVRSSDETVPLVELYTSEGCSSCPPADRWLSDRFGRGDANYLAFHVDYWDDIGWPDRFGSAQFAQRQRARVAAGGGSTVYTPQVMVGELVRVNWHDPRAWERTLRQARHPARTALAIRLDGAERGWHAVVGAAPNSGAGGFLWLARHVDDQTTRVGAGENRGKTLRHDRVVRELWGPWKLGTTPISERVSLSAESSPWGITAFVQDSRGQTLQSLNLDTSRCGAVTTSLQ